MQNRKISPLLPVPLSLSPDSSSELSADLLLDRSLEQSIDQSLDQSLKQSLDLAKAANTLADVKKDNQKLWLCLYFPKIHLELVADETDDQPQVIISEEGRGFFVHTACDTAREYGVSKNMPLNAAYALCPGLKVFHRDESKEIINISHIADWAQNFTSHVSIVSVDKILLEIKGSLAFFSGLSLMLQELEKSFTGDWPHCYQLAVSPTPLASQLLCELAEKIIIEDKEKLRPIIGDMSIDSILENNPRLLKRIKKTGVKTVQDIWRLPRDGLAKRFGVELLKTLDQLTGVMADPRIIHQIPLKFEQSIELPMETSNSKIINHAVDRLFEDLTAFLRQHDTGVVCLRVVLKHQHDSSDIILHLRQMTRSASHLSTLFIEKMERTRLSAAVIEMSLLVDEILPYIASSGALFAEGFFSRDFFSRDFFPIDKFPDATLSNKKHNVDPDWENTLEQLQNRLGPKAVKYLHLFDDIHPEFAWCYHSTISLVHQFGIQSDSMQRPLWLLSSAKPLKMQQNRPAYRGVLDLLQGPERIQTGWWRSDGQHISRDYYIALSAKAGYLWVYRDLNKNGRWYLHGFFG